MKLPTIATILLVLATPAHARMRHDRVCDIAQEKIDPTDYNPRGGNYIRFGKCGPIDDFPVGDTIGMMHLWNAFNCGYQAYRENQQLSASPYKTQQKTDVWKKGWETARKSCATGHLPFSIVDEQ
jgi:hypothetical protein